MLRRQPNHAATQPTKCSDAAVPDLSLQPPYVFEVTARHADSCRATANNGSEGIRLLATRLVAAAVRRRQTGAPSIRRHTQANLIGNRATHWHQILRFSLPARRVPV